MSQRSVVPLHVWEAHTAHLAATLGLKSLICKGEAASVADLGDHCIVVDNNFTVRANVVVIATGEKAASEESVVGDRVLAFDRGAVDRLTESYDEISVEGKGLSATYTIDLLLGKEEDVKWACRSNVLFQCSGADSKFSVRKADLSISPIPVKSDFCRYVTNAALQ